MYDELGDGGEGVGGDGQPVQHGILDPNRQAFSGLTTRQFDDVLADAPMIPDEDDDGMIDDDVTTEESSQKTPHEEIDEEGDSRSKSGEKSGEKSPENGQNRFGDVQGAPEAPESADVDAEDDDEEPLAPTQLGVAIDSLMMHWCQLLTNVTVKAPVPPPSTLDHVKEVAEVCSKHFRDASVDVNNELTRLGIQWEMEQMEEQSIIEDSNLDEAIERQERLLEQAREIIKNRLESFNKECPNAGKQFNT